MSQIKDRDLSYEVVRSLFDYHEDGYLTQKKSPANNVPDGAISGSLYNRGYIMVKINNRRYALHRVIFLWHHGYMPENEVDHIDRNKVNNKIENLREVSKQCNLRNQGLSKANKTGIKGVQLKPSGKYEAAIGVDRKRIYLGYFSDITDAAKARYKAEIDYNFYTCATDSTAYAHLKEKKLVP